MSDMNDRDKAERFEAEAYKRSTWQVEMTRPPHTVEEAVLDRAARLIEAEWWQGDADRLASPLDVAVATARKLAEEGLLIMDPLPDEDEDDDSPATWAKARAEAEYVRSLANDDQYTGGQELADMVIELTDEIDEDERRRDFQIARRLPQDVAEEIVDEYVDEDMHRGER